MKWTDRRNLKHFLCFDICLSSAERQQGKQSHRKRGGDHQAVPGHQQQGHQQRRLIQAWLKCIQVLGQNKNFGKYHIIYIKDSVVTGQHLHSTYR